MGQVVGADLEALTKDQTWRGRVEGGVTFIQEFGPEDRVAYRTASTFLTGRAHLNNDQLCIRYEGFFLDRTFCGNVYRNTASTNAESRYVSVSPDALRYFSAKGVSISR